MNTRAPTRGPHITQTCKHVYARRADITAPFGDAYEKIGTIQRRLAWPLHKDDTLFQSGRPTGLDIYFAPVFDLCRCLSRSRRRRSPLAGSPRARNWMYRNRTARTPTSRISTMNNCWNP
ncbi:hypothetical protein BC834DRAFT_834740 [Gloeopeniophorella convolvens]|nr:hypothetical protein BC834DRAFT_834740 [Gloeopeniophorella convolvens]